MNLQVISRMIQVHPWEWYILIGLFIMTVWTAFRFLQWLFCRSLPPVSYFLRKHFIYHTVLNRGIVLREMSRFELTAGILYAAANIVPLTLRMSSWGEAAVRSGNLATANLILLLVYTNLNFATRFLQLKRQIQSAIHRWVGSMALLETTVHSVTNGVKSDLRWDGIIVRDFRRSVVDRG
jgi:hypothetical protein